MVVSSKLLRVPHINASATKHGATSIHQVIRSCGAQPDHSKLAAQIAVNTINAADVAFGDGSIVIGNSSFGLRQTSGLLCVIDFSTNSPAQVRFVMLTLQVNGEQKQFPPDMNVSGLVAVMALAGKRFAIELNGEIVPKSSHASTALRDGDKLEVVIAVGGG